MTEFFDELKALNTSDEEQMQDFFRKKILHGTPYVFKNDESKYYEFRKRISKEYNINFHEVHITGSAKLGFSFSPLKKYKKFNYDSDIDVAIISNKLFDEMMMYIYEIEMGIRESLISFSQKDYKNYISFLQYTAIGWIRPDKIPFFHRAKILKKNWFSFFDDLSSSESNKKIVNYKVSAGVYKNYDVFEKYTISGLKNTARSL